MGLTAREQQLLDAAASEIYRSDTALAAFLLAFDRHSADEPMPERERVAASRRSSARQLRRRRRSLRPRRLPLDVLSRPAPRWARVATVLWVAITLAAVAATLAFSSGRNGSAQPGCSVPFAACSLPRTSQPAHHAGPAKGPG